MRKTRNRTCGTRSEETGAFCSYPIRLAEIIRADSAKPSKKETQKSSFGASERERERDGTESSDNEVPFGGRVGVY